MERSLASADAVLLRSLISQALATHINIINRGLLCIVMCAGYVEI